MQKIFKIGTAVLVKKDPSQPLNIGRVAVVVEHGTKAFNGGELGYEAGKYCKVQGSFIDQDGRFWPMRLYLYEYLIPLNGTGTRKPVSAKAKSPSGQLSELTAKAKP